MFLLIFLLCNWRMAMLSLAENNFIANGGFELGSKEWVLYDNTTSPGLTTNNVPCGKKAAVVLNTGLKCRKNFPVKYGEKYKIDVWLFPVSGKGKVTIAEFDSAEKWQNKNYIQLGNECSDRSWTKKTGFYTPTSKNIAFANVGIVAINGRLLLDEVSAIKIDDENIARTKNKTAPETFTVDLSRNCQMGFRDEIAGDKKGGWLDQGAKDLRNIPVGQITIKNIPFNIIDPKQNNEKSMIVLQGKERPWLPDKVVDIEVKRKINYLYFLCSGAWISKGAGKVADFLIKYTDRSCETIPVVACRNIGEWWGAKEVPDAELAWKGKSLGHTIGTWILNWKNPHSQKTISRVCPEKSKFFK